MGQSEAVRSYFDSIDDYDTCSDHVVPWNEEIQSTVYSGVFDYLGINKDGLISSLDLGVGTAHGAKVFLDGSKNSRMTGVDFSEKMLAKAKQNLSAAGLLGRVELISEDFTTWKIPESRFDVCFSAIAIHNASDEGKQRLFGGICSGLKPGAFFINGDFIRSESELGDLAWRDFYGAYMRRHLNGKELEAWAHHAFTEDKPARLSQQKEWLFDAGFSEFGVVWQKNNLAVYFARK